jgi:hypothetical protein
VVVYVMFYTLYLLLSHESLSIAKLLAILKF